MNTIILGECCKLISRGFNYARSEISKNKFDGYSVPQIGFSDIYEDGTFYTNNQVVFIRKRVADNYFVSNEDIILPPTTTTLPKAKGVGNYLGGVMLGKFVYSQNVVIIRLEENAPITHYELLKLLNTPKIQTRLLEEVYTGERVKSVSIEKLKKFEIPLPTKEQKEILKQLLNCEQELYSLNKQLKQTI